MIHFKKRLKLLEIIILYASKYGDFLQCACKKNEKNCPDLDDWLLVTLRARLCNHLKSCNLPEDITQEYKLGCAKIAL